MQRNEGTGTSNNAGDTGSFSVDRRSYLKLAGTAAGAAGLLSGTAAAERRGIRFNKTVDMVRDAGCDPNGNEPCDAKIRNAAEDYTLLKFPAGEYKLTEKNYIGGKTNIGFVGEGDVRFTVPSRLNEKVLVVDDGTGLLFENIDLDLRARDATPGLHFGASDDLEVHDIEYIGQGIHPNSDPRGGGNGNPNVTNAFTPIVRSSDGTGRVTNVVAKNDGLMGAYNAGEGRIGVWIGISHKGTVTLENCRFEGFPNNGLYCSRTGGAVQVEGGVFRNNDITQVRLSSRGSYAKNATIGADLDNCDSPNPDDALNTRGVRFEAGAFGFGGAQVRDCDISIVSTTNSSGAIVVGSDGANHGVYDSRIAVEEDKIRGFYAKAPTGFGSREPPPEPHTATIKNTSVTGGSNGAEALRIDQRDDSVVTDCCIHQTGSNRDGVKLADSPRNVVKNSTIDVSGQQVLSPGCSVTTSGLDASGSCPVPNQGGSGGLAHSLTIKGTGGWTDYSFTVSGEVEPVQVNGHDNVRNSGADGHVGAGTDRYAFSGELVAFDLDGRATVTVDGKPAHVGQRPDHSLTIEGTGGWTDYSFTTSGSVDPVQVNDHDTIRSNGADGHVGGGVDHYGFSGELVTFDLDGGATVTLDGKPAHVGQRPDHVLTINGAGGWTDYSFTVGGSVEPVQVNGHDNVRNNGADGHVGGGVDRYRFSGELVAFDLDGRATVTIDGKPAHVGQRPDHVLTIAGNGSMTTYDLIVGNSLEAVSTNGASVDANDSVTGTSASGGVKWGRDSYAFDGGIEHLGLNGGATVYLDGQQIDPDRYPSKILSIESHGSVTSYEFSTAKAVEKSDANDASIEIGDTVSGTSANGSTKWGRDNYAIAGPLTKLKCENKVRVVLDRSSRTIEFSGVGTYACEVSGTITPTADVENNDSVNGSSTSGYTRWGQDTYRYSGDLVSLTLDGASITIAN